MSIYGGLSLNTYIKQLFSGSVTYNKFENINEDKINELMEISKRFKSEKNRGIERTELERYIRIMQYLVSSFEGKLLPFDEKITLLINHCDPDLVHYKEYVSANILSKKAIQRAEVKEEKEFLTNKRNKQIFDLENKIRNSVGFCNLKLVAYERDYFNNVINKDKINLYPNEDYSVKLCSLIESVSVEDFNESNLKIANEIAMKLIASYSDLKNFRLIVANALFNQSNLLRIDNDVVKLLTFMLVVDPKLNVLTIYENESNFKRIIPLSRIFIGFFSKDFIKLEKMYHDLLVPDKTVSEWDVIKYTKVNN